MPAKTKTRRGITVARSVVDRVVKMTQNGKPRREIVASTGLNVYRVWQIQAAHGLTKNPAATQAAARDLVTVRARRQRKAS